MLPSSMKRPGVVATAGLLAILGIPLSRYWWSDHGKHPFERLERERREERAAMDALLPTAAGEIDCVDTSIVQRGTEVWAVGCGRRARYVLQNGAWRREGDVVPEEKPEAPKGCQAQWRSGDEGTAHDVALAAFAAKRLVRVHVPPAALGFVGLTKLRFEGNVEVVLANDAALAPCATDAGLDMTCPVPWDAVTDVAACDAARDKE